MLLLAAACCCLLLGHVWLIRPRPDSGRPQQIRSAASHIHNLVLINPQTGPTCLGHAHAHATPSPAPALLQLGLASPRQRQPACFCPRPLAFFATLSPLRTKLDGPTVCQGERLLALQRLSRCIAVHSSLACLPVTLAIPCWWAGAQQIDQHPLTSPPEIPLLE